MTAKILNRCDSNLQRLIFDIFDIITRLMAWITLLHASLRSKERDQFFPKHQKNPTV